ncbi:MAG: hypothetical protein AB8F26_04875 [Phycisphaerales bacterium]
MNRSHIISGTAALIMMAAPLLGSVFWSRDSLSFIRNAEKREPAGWPRPSKPADFFDSVLWQQVNLAINDRIPFRGDLLQLKLDLETRLLKEQLLGANGNEQVGLGRDGWLFLLQELGGMSGTDDEITFAISKAEAAGENPSWKARLVLVPAPDKNSIYPEQLSPELERQLQPYAAKRERIRNWFASPGLPERLDTWSVFFRAKPNAEEALYEPTGSHHSSYGSMLLARAMIDAANPDLWDDDFVTHVRTLTYQSDLRSLAGWVGRTEDWKRYEVIRPGVELTAFLHNGELLEGVDRPPETPGAQNKPARYINQSDSAELVPGRTLIVHDSFIASYLRPTLRQFFADVTFVHSDTIKPGDLQDALRSFDLVYFEFAERGARPILQGFFTDQTPAGEDRILQSVALPGRS